MRTFTFNGRLGKDAELNTANGGTQYLKFSVANNSYSKTDGEKTEWIDVVCFDPFLVKSKQQILKKGVFVIVSGELDPITTTTLQDGRTYINQRVNANFIEVPNFGKADSVSGATATTAAQPQAQPQMMPQAPQQAIPQGQPVAQPQMMPQQPVYSAQIPGGIPQNDGTGDLPF
jgi:single stranded DNA-binding protein